MDLTPSQVSAATFRTVRKGYDPDQVEEFLGEVALALEQARQHSTAMEARARAAVARLQEATAAQQVGESTGSGSVVAPPPVPSDVHVAPDEAETISRTLLLAQRTADTTLAEAKAEAERITAEAESEAESTLDSTREMSASLLEEARAEARQVGEAEREEALNAVEELKARREFLVGDVDQLEQFLIDQRERLRGAARQIEALCERVPSGLASVRPPALSAADDESEDTDDTDAEFERLAQRAVGGEEWSAPDDETAELIVPPEASGPFADIGELAEALDESEADTSALDKPVEVEDPGPNVEPDEAPHLPKRNAASD